ncbi:MAG: ATP-dependent RNA helicase [Candidatus Altiarchaeales archaeon WOR_SM1_86-2]|nr:MAG: ATP-dependent RNA helicase [Candidatus Altiarchaeales archaeon WOR_SM1_86-2]
MEYFRELGIIEPILKSIEEEGFEKPTEIQEKSIPLVLAGRDVMAGAATGSGKTLAFASGIIANSEKGNGIQALVLTPTRELAEQVAEALKTFSKYTPLKIAVVYGGLSINPQINALRTADVVIGTPGRLLDHIERRTIELGSVKTLVLDEADRMLDMGFIDDVEKIIKQCNVRRQTLLFSATISGDISNLARKYMKDAVEVSAESYVDPKKLTQVCYDVADNLKFSLLVHLLKHEKSGLVMVFCNTRRNVDFVANNLKSAGTHAMAIHGGFSQEKRNNTMKHFHSQKVYVLVCTDVAARGLDIQGVSHVYNYDIPKESKQYIHRIGRTARAGKEGKAINILARREDYENLTQVLRDHEVDIIKEKTPYVKRVGVAWRETPRRWAENPKNFRTRDRRYGSGYRR